ncbi:MAG TPA: SurA N-terminal domain-containing protein, partial [Burkholderiaceae bacterium]|nr:SurA N-terminal domain-containing protein [Burkholderiaceae bacterium]
MPCPLTTRLSTYCLAALFVLLIAVMPGMQAVAQTDSSPSLRQLQGSADATASEPESDPEPGGRASVDAIAAIVNKDVITMRQLDQETETARAQMREQNIPEPDADTLRKQVLQRMILNTLELQEARAQGMEVNDAEVERVLDMIAERNGVSRETMRADIEASGFNWDVYIKDLRQDILLDQLRQRVVESTIEISDAEVDAFLRSEGKDMSLLATGPSAEPAPQPAPRPEAQSRPAPANPTVAEAAQHTGGQVMIGLAHILVAVPESASSAEVAELQRKAESLQEQVASGADFAGVAAASSDGPQALDGGDMGVRHLQGWPDLFIEAIQDRKQGDV